MTGNDAMEDAIGTAAGMMLLAVIESLKVGGMEPQKAVRLATMVMLEGAFGRGVWDLVGIPSATGRRWRAEVRALDEAGLIPDEPSVDFMERVTDLVAAETKRKMRESRGE